MRSDKSQAISSMTMRQKVTAAVLVVVLIVVIYEVFGLFGGKGKGATPTPTVNQSATAMSGSAPGTPTPPQQVVPQQANLIKLQQPPVSERELQLIQLQQETQAKYISALNELQMLKVSREIAETNQAIVAAKLATVTAEKNIVNMLAPQQQVAPAQYARGLVNPVSSGNAVTTTTTQTQTLPSQPEVTYSVISVSQLQYRWSAVLGYQGSLYNVSVGDVLPADGSSVVAIGKSGVVLERAGVKRKLSLVPII